MIGCSFLRLTQQLFQVEKRRANTRAATLVRWALVVVVLPAVASGQSASALALKATSVQIVLVASSGIVTGPTGGSGSLIQEGTSTNGFGWVQYTLFGLACLGLLIGVSALGHRWFAKRPTNTTKASHGGVSGEMNGPTSLQRARPKRNLEVVGGAARSGAAPTDFDAMHTLLRALNRFEDMIKRSEQDASVAVGSLLDKVREADARMDSVGEVVRHLDEDSRVLQGRGKTVKEQHKKALRLFEEGKQALAEAEDAKGRAAESERRSQGTLDEARAERADAQQLLSEADQMARRTKASWPRVLTIEFEQCREDSMCETLLNDMTREDTRLAACRIWSTLQAMETIEDAEDQEVVDAVYRVGEAMCAYKAQEGYPEGGGAFLKDLLSEYRARYGLDISRVTVGDEVNHALMECCGGQSGASVNRVMSWYVARGQYSRRALVDA